MVSGGSVRSYEMTGVGCATRMGCRWADIPGSGMEWYGEPNPSSGGVWRPSEEGSVEVEKLGDGVAEDDAYCGTKWTCFPGIVVVIWVGWFAAFQLISDGRYKRVR